MPSNTFGELYSITSFGESHGKYIGTIVDGCPAGLSLDETDIQPLLDLRKPGQSVITTQRKELDTVTIISGVFNGYTTGAPICLTIQNKDTDSKAYEELKDKPRPGHSDYTAFIKYGGFNDFRGSGRFSGRLTATLVMAGAIALKLLKTYLNIEIISYTKSIGHISFNSENKTFEELSKNRYSNEVRCPDEYAAEKMKAAIMMARKDGDSLGGIIECKARGIPAGLGDPIFASIESELSKGLFSIPAVKGVEFGSGFKGSTLRGSENNDQFEIDKYENKIITHTNNSGGILGGITNGMPLEFRIALKPAASIPKIQRTVNLRNNEETNLVVKGRHDPCVVPRAPPVVDSIVAVILLDKCLKDGLIPHILSSLGGR